MLRMILLALLQWITEFLPVSSSGHLVLAKYFLGFNSGAGALVEIVLHGGSLLAIILYYRRRLADLISAAFKGEPWARKYAGLLILGCLPVCGMYLLWGGQIEPLFQNPGFAAGALLVTGLAVCSLRWANSGGRKLTPWRALAVGVAQMLALLPGISRSGATIAAARHLGIRGEEAASFSFLMAVPLLLLGSLLGAWRLWQGVDMGDATPVTLTAGFLVSALAGLCSIHVLMRTLRHNSFWAFGLYTLVVGSVSILALLLR